MEYIDDATPGPGAYNLSCKSLARYTKPTKVEKFGITIDRFKVKKDNSPRLNINPMYP